MCQYCFFQRLKALWGQVIWVFDTPCLWGNDTNLAIWFCSITEWCPAGIIIIFPKRKYSGRKLLMYDTGSIALGTIPTLIFLCVFLLMVFTKVYCSSLAFIYSLTQFNNAFCLAWNQHNALAEIKVGMWSVPFQGELNAAIVAENPSTSPSSTRIYLLWVISCTLFVQKQYFLQAFSSVYWQ